MSAPVDDYVYLRDGSVLGRITGWTTRGGELAPLIDTTDRPTPRSSTDPDLAGEWTEPRSRDESPSTTEAPAGEAAARTRAVEPATTPDLAPEAAGGASPTPRAASRG